MGEAEQNVRKLFETAKQHQRSVIFIDEIEAMVPRRRAEGSTVMARVVPQILQELEGFDRNGDRALLFVGATNKPWMLDEAMLRPGRFDTLVYVGLPDAPARFRLLEIYLADRPIADDMDLGVLCDHLEGYSGADIRNLCMQAAQVAFVDAMGGSERLITLSRHAESDRNADAIGETRRPDPFRQVQTDRPLIRPAIIKSKINKGILRANIGS